MPSLSAREPCWLGDVTATFRPSGASHMGGTECKLMLDSYLPQSTTDSDTFEMFTFCGDPLQITLVFFRVTKIGIMHLQHFIYSLKCVNNLIYFRPTNY